MIVLNQWAELAEQLGPKAAEILGKMAPRGPRGNQPKINPARLNACGRGGGADMFATCPIGAVQT